MTVSCVYVDAHDGPVSQSILGPNFKVLAPCTSYLKLGAEFILSYHITRPSKVN